MPIRSTVRALSILVGAAALSLLMASAASAQIPGYPGGGPSVTFKIDDSTVVAGQTVGVSGTGCGAGDTVTFTIDGSTVGATTASSTGTYSSTVTIPGLPDGTYTVNATCGGDVLGLSIILGNGGGSLGASTGTGGLARTGSNLMAPIGAGTIAVALGGAAVYGSRRRRESA